MKANHTTMYYKADDAEALAVLIRYAESQGAKVCRVRPINNYFGVELEAPKDFEITNQTDLEPYKADLERCRTYWSDIGKVDESCVRFLKVFDE